MDPRSIATWRYEQILEVLGKLSKEVRGELVHRIAAKPALWPSGDTRPISSATIYRWIAAYEAHGMEGLAPRRRKDKGIQRARLSDDVVNKAIELISEDEELTLTMIVALLRADPALSLGEAGLRISRSTLHRRIRAHPRFAQLARTKKRARHRRRFVAKKPHEIWHTDAKGPVEVRSVSGKTLTFHVLTILDNATRAVLAALVAPSADLCAAVRVFRRAAKRWGLPDRLYADRASIFDSKAFRSGLAELGSHRIRVKPRNPEANGKIEAYHRSLVLWFTGRLKRQQVVDLVHLQQLLDGVIETVYQDHWHRGLKASPRATLAGRISARTISAPRLENAFKEERRKKAHPKTGEVELCGVTYVVPEHLRGQKLVFRTDPDPDLPPLVVEPKSRRELMLERAHIHPDDAKNDRSDKIERWGQGSLQRLYDSWQGKIRPNAEPGFGLFELFGLLERLSGRGVPRSDAEAAFIQSMWREIGPLPRNPTESALDAILHELGEGRPIKTYLDALKARVESESERNKRS